MEELGSKRQMAVRADGTHVDDPSTVTMEDVASTHENPVIGMAYGKYFPEFWIQLPNDKNATASAGNGTHVAFSCKSAEQVQRVYQAAIENGAVDNGKPGPRTEYSDKYYGAFFIDPMGNKLEAGEWWVRFKANWMSYCYFSVQLLLSGTLTMWSSCSSFL